MQAFANHFVAFAWGGARKGFAAQSFFIRPTHLIEFQASNPKFQVFNFEPPAHGFYPTLET
jgi:hypothetical protein